jgi:hypothetical protein
MNTIGVGEGHVRVYHHNDETANSSGATAVEANHNCQKRHDTVWMMCGDAEVKQWGIGPEGEDKALKNCKWAVENWNDSKLGVDTCIPKKTTYHQHVCKHDEENHTCECECFNKVSSLQ